MKLKILYQYCKNTQAVAAIEAAFVLPVMIVILFGVVDVGTSIVINTKIISATQIASDLITRKNAASDFDIQEARLAAEAALRPYVDDNNFGIDIAAVRFMGEDAIPEEQWRETYNMLANTSAIAESAGLGLQGEGVLIVTVEYRYAPRFSAFATGDFIMREVSFARGRDSTFITRY